MFGERSVGVVMPAFNEGALIGQALAQVPAFVDRVVVVDDASGDDTAAAAWATKRSGLEVVTHRENRGVGAAIATGYQRLLSRGVDLMVVMAADAQMDPRDLPALLGPVANGEADYVKGDRLSWPDARARMPAARWIGNHALSWLTRRALGVAVQDSQCGYTVAARAAVAAVDLGALWPRYGYPNDLLGQLVERGARVQDVPIRPVYASEESGVSLRHALAVVPYVIVRAGLRRMVVAPKLETA